MNKKKYCIVLQYIVSWLVYHTQTHYFFKVSALNSYSFLSSSIPPGPRPLLYILDSVEGSSKWGACCQKQTVSLWEFIRRATGCLLHLSECGGGEGGAHFGYSPIQKFGWIVEICKNVEKQMQIKKESLKSNQTHSQSFQKDLNWNISVYRGENNKFHHNTKLYWFNTSWSYRKGCHNTILITWYPGTCSRYKMISYIHLIRSVKFISNHTNKMNIVDHWINIPPRLARQNKPSLVSHNNSPSFFYFLCSGGFAHIFFSGLGNVQIQPKKKLLIYFSNVTKSK